MRPWEDLEFQTEYEWSAARKSPRQRRAGIIALTLFAVVAAALLIACCGSSTEGIW